MNKHDAETVVRTMGEISSQVAEMSAESISALAAEVQAIPIGADQALKLVRARVMHHRAGERRPLSGDFIRDMWAQVNKGRLSASGGDHPRNWSGDTLRRLSYLHESSSGRGPVGALAELIRAGRIDEPRMRAMMSEAAKQHGEWVKTDPRNPFLRPGANPDGTPRAPEQPGVWLKIDRPMAMAYLNELIFEAVRQAGADPDEVIQQWRKRARGTEAA